VSHRFNVRIQNLMARRTKRQRRTNKRQNGLNRPNMTREMVNNMAWYAPPPERQEYSDGLAGVLERQVEGFNKIQTQYPDNPGLLGISSRAPLAVVKDYVEHGIQIPAEYDVTNYGSGARSATDSGQPAPATEAPAQTEGGDNIYRPTDPTAWRKEYWGNGNDPRVSSTSGTVAASNNYLPGFEPRPHPMDVPTPTARPNDVQRQAYEQQMAYEREAYGLPEKSPVDIPGSAPIRAASGLGNQVSPEDLAAIQDMATEWNIQQAALVGVLNIESGINPGLQGGAGNNYHGISQIQGQQIPALTERAGLGRLTPDEYRQLGVADQLKVTDQYLRQYGIKPSGNFFKNDASDTARLMAMQLAPSRAVAGKIDFNDPNAVISRTNQADRIEASQGLVTVGSVQRTIIEEGLGILNNTPQPQPRDQSIAQDIGPVPNAPIDTPNSLGYTPAPQFAPTGRRSQEPDTDIIQQADVLAKTMYGPDYGFTAFAGQEPPSAMLAGSRLNHPKGKAADGYLTYRGQPVQDRAQAAEFLQGFVAANKDASIGFGQNYMTRAGYPNAANMHVQVDRGLAWGDRGRSANLDPELKAGIDAYRGTGQLPRNYYEDERFTPTIWQGEVDEAGLRVPNSQVGQGMRAPTPSVSGSGSSFSRALAGRSTADASPTVNNVQREANPWAELADDSTVPEPKAEPALLLGPQPNYATPAAFTTGGASALNESERMGLFNRPTPASWTAPDANDPRGDQIRTPEYKTITTYETRYRDEPIEWNSSTDKSSNQNQSDYEMAAYGPMGPAGYADPEKKQPQTRRVAYQVPVTKRVPTYQSPRKASTLDTLLTRRGAVKSRQGALAGGLLGGLAAGPIGGLVGRAVGNQAGSFLANNYNGMLTGGNTPDLSRGTNVGTAKAAYSAPKSAGPVYGTASSGALVTVDPRTGQSSITSNVNGNGPVTTVTLGGLRAGDQAGTGSLFGGDDNGGGGK
jgi:hypothetical protein